jgi:hypothetical protein
MEAVQPVGPWEDCPSAKHLGKEIPVLALKLGFQHIELAADQSRNLFPVFRDIGDLQFQSLDVETLDVMAIFSQAELGHEHVVFPSIANGNGRFAGLQ